MCIVIFIMSFKFNSMLYAFFVQRMLNETFYCNYDSFLHFIADNFTNTGNTCVSFFGHDCFLLVILQNS